MIESVKEREGQGELGKRVRWLSSVQFHMVSCDQMLGDGVSSTPYMWPKHRCVIYTLSTPVMCHYH
jgi:hypothetical protein